MCKICRVTVFTFVPIIALCGTSNIDDDGASFHPFVIVLWWLYIYSIAIDSKAYPRTAEKISTLRTWRWLWCLKESYLLCAVQHLHEPWIRSQALPGRYRCWQGRSCTRWITCFYTEYSRAMVQRCWPPCWLWTCSISLLRFVFLEEMPESWHWQRGSEVTGSYFSLICCHSSEAHIMLIFFSSPGTFDQ